MTFPLIFSVKNYNSGFEEEFHFSKNFQINILDNEPKYICSIAQSGCSIGRPRPQIIFEKDYNENLFIYHDGEFFYEQLLDFNTLDLENNNIFLQDFFDRNFRSEFFISDDKYSILKKEKTIEEYNYLKKDKLKNYFPLFISKLSELDSIFKNIYLHRNSIYRRVSRPVYVFYSTDSITNGLASAALVYEDDYNKYPQSSIFFPITDKEKILDFIFSYNSSYTYKNIKGYVRNYFRLDDNYDNTNFDYKQTILNKDFSIQNSIIIVESLKNRILSSLKDDITNCSKEVAFIYSSLNKTETNKNTIDSLLSLIKSSRTLLETSGYEYIYSNLFNMLISYEESKTIYDDLSSLKI